MTIFNLLAGIRTLSKRIVDELGAHYDSTRAGSVSVKVSGLRRGFITSNVLIRASFIGAACAMGTVFSVSQIEDNESKHNLKPSSADSEYQQSTISVLEQLFTGCIEVINVHNGDISPYSDYILWVSDNSDPGKINRSEIMLLSHNRDLRSISIYQHDASPRERSSLISSGEENNSMNMLSGREVLGRKKLSDAEFIDQLRSMATVSAETIAIRVSELSIKPLKTNRGNGSPLKIELVWSEYSTDAEDHGFFIVDATMNDTTYLEVKE